MKSINVDEESDNTSGMTNSDEGKVSDIEDHSNFSLLQFCISRQVLL